MQTSFVQGSFYEAVVQSINTKEKTLVACFPDDLGMDSACFELDYDILVLGEDPSPLRPPHPPQPLSKYAAGCLRFSKCLYSFRKFGKSVNRAK